MFLHDPIYLLEFWFDDIDRFALNLEYANFRAFTANFLI